MLTIDAFGQPFEVEWVSDDCRVYASREKCLQLRSFSHLRESDGEALRLNRPVALEWRETATDPELEPFRQQLRQQLQGSSVERWKKPTSNHPTQASDDKKPYAKMFLPPLIKPVRVVCAVLMDGTQLLFRRESGQFQQVPFTAQKEIAQADALMKAQPVTSKEESIANDLLEIGALLRKKDERVMIARAINGLNWPQHIVNAVIQYGAGGKSEQDAAKIMQTSPRNFRRYVQALRAKLPADLKTLFEGSISERQKRNKVMDTEKIRRVVQGVQISRDTAKKEDDDAAYIAEKFSDLRPDA